MHSGIRLHCLIVGIHTQQARTPHMCKSHFHCSAHEWCPRATVLQEHQVREAQEIIAHRADDEAASDLREREQRLVVALADAQASLAAVSRKHQDAQDKLLELHQRKEDSAAGAEADAELANEELDRAKMQ